MPIDNLLQSQTFRAWFQKTNELVDALNGSVLTAGSVANGAFVANGSLQVVNTFFANSTVVELRGNTAIKANTVVTANVWNFAGNTVIIQPINGTVVNSAIQFNATAPVTFLGVVSANANITVTADYTQTGNALFNGTLSSNAGPIIARQVLFASANAILAPAVLVSPQYDDFAPTAFQDCEVLNLTPSLDVVITGLAAPGFTTGARILYIQNIGVGGFNITLASANTSSGVNNRFKFPNDTSAVIPPGGAVPLIWSTTNKEWRALAPSTQTFASLTVAGVANLAGNVVVGGWLNVVHQLVVQGNSAVTGNLTQTGNATFGGFANVTTTLQVGGLSTLTGNVTFGGFANVTTTLQVGGNAILSGWANVAGAINVAGNTTATGNATFGGFANVLSTFQVSGNSVFNGTRLFANGQVRCDTTNGRLVLPVGAGLWAT